MPNYQNGKIYRLVSNKTEDVYYGATVNPLPSRKNQHKSRLDCSSKKLFENDAVVTIVLVEAFPCNNKNELKARELFYITNNPCININKPFISELNHGVELKKEYYEVNKETILEQKKEYYETNKEALLEQRKEYREANKEAISEQKKEHYEANKEAISKQKKEYYEANKEAISERDKEYYEAHKEAISEQKKAYREANKEAISERRKQYNEANKEAISERRRQAYKNKKAK